MNKNKNSSHSKISREERKANTNSYGYDVSMFNELEILPVRKESSSDPLTSTGKQISEKTLKQKE